MTAKKLGKPLAPDDPRHGTYAGASAHWKAGQRLAEVCPPCCAAGSRRRKGNLYRRRQGGAPALVPRIGYARRINALRALGWSLTMIADEIGTTTNFLAHIVNGRVDGRHRSGDESITVATALRVQEAYQKLAMTVPEGQYTQRVRLIAKARRWAPPLAWEFLDIDDPNVEPWGWDIDINDVLARRRRAARGGGPAATDRRHQLEECIANGGSISDAVRLTGASRSALQKWCGNHQLHHLYRTLADREDGMAHASQMPDPRPVTPDDRAA